MVLYSTLQYILGMSSRGVAMAVFENVTLTFEPNL